MVFFSYSIYWFNWTHLDQQHTPLHYACYHGNLSTLVLLVERGADVNLCDKNKNSPLHYVSSSGNAEAAAYLLSKHASVNCVANEGETPLHLALKNENFLVASILLENNADFMVADAKGTSPYALGVASTDERIVALFKKLNPTENNLSVEVKMKLRKDRYRNEVHHFKRKSSAMPFENVTTSPLPPCRFELLGSQIDLNNPKEILNVVDKIAHQVDQR